MSDLSFEQMLEETIKTIHTGEIVVGKIIDVKEDLAVLNVGYKSDGILTRNEYSNDAALDLRTVLHVGDELEVKVLKVNDGEGQLILSYKRIAQDKAKRRLEEAFENHEVLKAKVSQVVSGGICIDVDGNRVFVPASLVSDTYEKDLGKYQDQEIEFVITECNPRRKRIIGDRKQLIVARKAELQKEFFEKIQVGDRIEGTVKSIMVFGAFVDIGGVDGLLHITEMGWGRIGNPKNLLKPGDKITVLIKDITGRRVSLSCKFPEENPWNNAREKYAVGNIVKGKVVRLTDFGAFVELDKGVDGLIHVSQITKKRIEHPSEVLEAGQEIEALVVDFNEEEKRISLSTRSLESQKADSEEVQPEQEAAEAIENETADGEAED